MFVWLALAANTSCYQLHQALIAERWLATQIPSVLANQPFVGCHYVRGLLLDSHEVCSRVLTGLPLWMSKTIDDSSNIADFPLVGLCLHPHVAETLMELAKVAKLPKTPALTTLEGEHGVIASLAGMEEKILENAIYINECIRSMEDDSEKDLSHLGLNNAKECIATAKAWLSSRENDVVEAMISGLGTLFGDLAHCVTQPSVARVASQVDEGITMQKVATLLLAVQTSEYRTLYSKYTIVESVRDVAKQILERKALTLASDDAIKSLAELDLQQQSAGSFVALSAAIQGLCRPLRAGETRDKLAGKAHHLITQAKQLSCPPNMLILLCKTAGIDQAKS